MRENIRGDIENDHGVSDAENMNIQPHVGAIIAVMISAAGLLITWGQFKERIETLKNNAKDQKNASDLALKRLHKRHDEYIKELKEYVTKSEFDQFKIHHDQQMASITDMLTRQFDGVGGKLGSMSIRAENERREIADKLESLSIQMATFDDCRRRCSE